MIGVPSRGCLTEIEVSSRDAILSNELRPFSKAGFRTSFRMVHPFLKSSSGAEVRSSRPLMSADDSISDSSPSALQSKGLSRHVCPICNQSFGRTEHLERHIAAHKGSRPWICEYCRSRFSRKCLPLVYNGLMLGM